MRFPRHSPSTPKRTERNYKRTDHDLPPGWIGEMDKALDQYEQRRRQKGKDDRQKPDANPALFNPEERKERLKKAMETKKSCCHLSRNNQETDK